MQTGTWARLIPLRRLRRLIFVALRWSRDNGRANPASEGSEDGTAAVIPQVKLLFGANLSPRLVTRLADLFADSVHLFSTTLERFTTDETIWNYARLNGLTIIRIENCRYGTPWG